MESIPSDAPKTRWKVGGRMRDTTIYSSFTGPGRFDDSQGMHLIAQLKDISTDKATYRLHQPRGRLRGKLTSW